MTPLFKFFLKTKTITAWKSGNSQEFVWNYWHPLTWIIVPNLIIAQIIVYGASDLIENPLILGLTVNPHWDGKEREFLK